MIGDNEEHFVVLQQKYVVVFSSMFFEWTD